MLVFRVFFVVFTSVGMDFLFLFLLYFLSVSAPSFYYYSSFPFPCSYFFSF